MTSKEFILIPVWLLTLVLKPFLRPDHPWRRQKLTLASWGRNGTEVARQFGAIFWCWFLVTAMAVFRIWYLHGK